MQPQPPAPLLLPLAAAAPRARYRLALSTSLSLLVHVLVLLFAATSGESREGEHGRHTERRLSARLAPATPPKPAAAPPPPAATPPPPPSAVSAPRRRELLTRREPTAAPAPPADRPGPVPARPPPVMAPSIEPERDDMLEFLRQEEAAQRAAREGSLVERARAQARALPPEPQAPDAAELIQQRLRDAGVERLSLELYFDALFRKINRSAAMVRNSAPRGQRDAAVRVEIGPDGRARSFRILWAADQQAQIEYVRAVIERAAPFAAFPPDIRRATDTLILDICITPGTNGDPDGAAFTRLGRGARCGG